MQINVPDYKVKLFLKLWGWAAGVLSSMALYMWAMISLASQGYITLVVFLSILGLTGLWAGVCALVESPPRS